MSETFCGVCRHPTPGHEPDCPVLTQEPQSELLTKLRAWVFLRGASQYWQVQGLSDVQVCRMSEERLKVVALFSVLLAGRDQGKEQGLKLWRELNAIGYGPGAFENAKREIDALFDELRA